MDKFPGLYAKTINIGRQIRDAYDNILKDFNVIVMPTTPFVAPRHGTRESVLASFEPSIGLTSNTAVLNVTGHPALSIPIGYAPAADNASVMLPVGMQIVGGMWQEQTVLEVGHAWETNFDWKKSCNKEEHMSTLKDMKNHGLSGSEMARRQDSTASSRFDCSPELKSVKLTA